MNTENWVFNDNVGLINIIILLASSTQLSPFPSARHRPQNGIFQVGLYVHAVGRVR